ncbi:MAG TPA: zf-HC2 domain-containing protein [Ktedonobacterales bacterium]
MTSPTAETCALGLTDERLSAWRDGLLDPVEIARIRAHTTTCRACQRRLDNFERMGWTLRSQRTPDLRSQVWRGLQTRMRETGRSSMTARTRTLWASGAAVAAALVLVALFASLLARRAGSPTLGGGTPGTTATTGAPTPSATATQVPAQAPPGWKFSQGLGTSMAPDIAFALSSPSSAYAYTETAGAIVVYVSQDRGQTWRSLGTATTGQNSCDLSVDPTNARDVLLICTPAASSGFTVLRSLDGGVTWTRPHVDVSVNCYGGSGWAGPTPLLAFSLCDSGGGSQTQILASVDRGPFTRLDVNGKLGGTVVGNIPLLGGSATAMYVQTGYMQFDSSGAQMNETTLRSDDGGKTWAPVSFSAGGTRIHLLTMTPDGQTFVGVYDGAPTHLALSIDNGRSWRSLPAGPDGVPSFNDVLVAPDGAIVAVSSRLALLDNPDPRFFYLPAGASAWSSPFNMPANAYPRALAVDSSGHPTALWALYALDDRGTAWELIAHTL